MPHLIHLSHNSPPVGHYHSHFSDEETEARLQRWDSKPNWWVQVQGTAHHPAATAENRRQDSTRSAPGKQRGFVCLLAGWVSFQLCSGACRIPEQGLNPGLQQWGCRVLTKLPGNSQQCGFVCFLNKDAPFKDTHGGPQTPSSPQKTSWAMGQLSLPGRETSTPCLPCPKHASKTGQPEPVILCDLWKQLPFTVP